MFACKNVEEMISNGGQLADRPTDRQAHISFARSKLDKFHFIKFQAFSSLSGVKRKT